MRTRNDDNRDNHAWRAVVWFAKYLGPTLVLIENVGGLKTYRSGAVCMALERAFRAQGYKVRLYDLDAADFGVPQRRKRIFLLASRGACPESIPVADSRRVSVAEALRDLPVVGNGNEADELPYRLHGRSLNRYQRAMREGTDGTVANCRCSRSTDPIIERFRCIPPGGNWQDIPAGMFRTYSKPENCHRWLYRRLAADEPSVTISNFRKNMLIHPWEDRTLTVREAARLQGITDRFVFLGNLQAQQQQVANAVPPNMAEAIIRAALL